MIRYLIDWEAGTILGLDQKIANVEDTNILPDDSLAQMLKKLKSKVIGFCDRHLIALRSRVKQLRGEDYALLVLQNLAEHEINQQQASQPLIFDPTYNTTLVNNPNFGSARIAGTGPPAGTSTCRMGLLIFFT